MSLFHRNNDAQVPVNYTVKDKQLFCHHCGNDKFIKEHVVIHLAGEMVNTPVTCIVCSECTYMHWFHATE